MRFLKCLFVLSASLCLATDALAQSKPECKEIDVEVTVNSSQGSTTASLRFGPGLHYQNFRLFLFAEDMRDNRWDFTDIEIRDLKKGNYILVIQGKNNKEFCTKKIDFKIL